MLYGLYLADLMTVSTFFQAYVCSMSISTTCLPTGLALVYSIYRFWLLHYPMVQHNTYGYCIIVFLQNVIVNVS